MMNYNKLKELLTKSNLTIKKAAASIDRTENWFYSAVKNDTMTVADLEKLLKLCKISIAEFFGGQAAANYVQEPSVKESELAEENNELLRENRKLRMRIEELEEKTAGKKPERVKPKQY